MKAVADTLAVARSNLIERVSRRAKSRRPYRDDSAVNAGRGIVMDYEIECLLDHKLQQDERLTRSLPFAPPYLCRFLCA